MNAENQNASDLFAERQTRIEDVIALREPDRVPSFLFSTFWAAKAAGMTCEQAMYDYKGLSGAMRKAILELQPDAFQPCHPMLCLGPTMEITGYRQLEWPGDGKTDPNVSFQYLDKEYMEAGEYDEFLLDPTGFYLRNYLPRLADVFEPFANLPEYPSIYYTRVMHSLAVFGDPKMQESLQKLMRAGEEMLTMLEENGRFIKEMNETGYPLAAVASGHAPFDVVADYMRGSKGGMLDMFRNKEKLLGAIDKVTEFVPRNIIKTAQRLPGDIIFIPLHWGLDGFMSPDQFKTFFWPSLRELMLTLIENGLTPCPFWEGDVTSRLDIIKDIPPGKCIYFFERTDLAKAKKILGDTVCIRGGMPVSTLITGSVEDVRDRCKEMIDIVGDGGGYIMDASVGIPDEAKPENVQAMFEVTREYGTYR